MTARLFLERTFDEPLTVEDVSAGGRELRWCLDVHRCRWHGSFLALDGRTMICSFSGPDMESARIALRDPDMDLSHFWAGTEYRGANTVAPNVVVERQFEAPVLFEDIKALSQAAAWCLDTYNVKYSHSIHSLDRKRMLCFYSAPDAEAVRSVQREARAPVSAIWAGTSVTPE
jgi:hypothetical protein